MLITWKYKLVKCKRSRSKLLSRKKEQINDSVSRILLKNFNREKKSFPVVCQVLFLCKRMQNYRFSKKWSEISQEANCNQETLCTRITQSTDFSCFNRSLKAVFQALGIKSFPLCPNSITIQTTSHSNEYSKHV